MNNMTTKIVSTGPRLTEKRIARAEKALGVSFPAVYRRFLLEHNGGYPDDPHFRMPGARKGSTRLGAVVDFAGIDTPEETTNIDYLLQTFQDRVPARMFPIARDPGGNLILLSSKGKDAGTVYFWDHEREADDGESPTERNLVAIADSFDAFLKKLGNA